MSKFKTMVRKDIALCNKYIEDGFATKEDVKALVGKYSIDCPNFGDGLINYVGVLGHENNEIANIRIIKEKLQYLLNRNPNQQLYGDEKKSSVVVTSINNNTNANYNSFNITIEEVRSSVENNTDFDDVEKKELLSKLDEIVALRNSEESKGKKWSKAKKIIEYVMDKGVDVAIMYIPQIIMAINS